MTKIDVSDHRAGTIIMNALIGNCLEMFEIRLHHGRFCYWVRDVEVPVETYRDALALATLDRFDPKDTTGTFMTSLSNEEAEEPDRD